MKKKSILLVEDDAVVRDMIREAIEREYRVLEASSYSEAVNHLNKHIDLAIIDYVLPDIDGFELLKTIREAKPLLPAIIMTAFSTESVAIRALRTGVTDYIKKPLSILCLKMRLSEILEGKEEDTYPECIENREEFIMDSMAMYIEQNYMEDLSLKNLSKKAGISKYKFCRVFKQRFGRGFKSYINAIRIKNAAELLKNPDLNITQIADFVGFGGVSNFTRMFKKKYMESPLKYRRRLKNRY